MGKKRKSSWAIQNNLRGDGQLMDRIVEVLEIPALKSGPMTSDRAYEILISTHREYARKPQKELKDLLSNILIARRTTKAVTPTPTGSGSQNGAPANKGQKRKSEESEEDSEADMDVPDKGNLLNSSLYASNRKRAKPSPNTNKAMSKESKLDKEIHKAIHAKIGENEIQAVRPTVRFSDMGGIDSCLQDIRELCSYPLSHPEIYQHLGIEPPRGILLHGPPGCGKTMLARAIAGELGVTFFHISAPEIVSGMSGESEEKVRKLFNAARDAAPSIIFIDEIDAITGKRETSSRGMERRIVAQLLTCMDSLRIEDEHKDEDGEEDEVMDDEPKKNNTVLVIGATNRPDALDPALRRAGRFDREIAMGIPDKNARARILQCISSNMRLDGDFDFMEIARLTPGFVGADLNALAKEAAVIAVNRVFSELVNTSASSEDADALEKRTMAAELLTNDSTPLTKEQLDPVYIKMEDFILAVGKVQPSAKREGFATVPSVTWDDIGSLGNVREELSMAISEPIRHPERFQAMGLSAPSGVLLYGPPGCGKTMLAKAIANSSGSNFISIKGPELLNKFVGESERAVRQVFARARSSAPCVVFFDELDSLCPRRGSDGSNGVSERVVNQLLTEMDGLEERRNVFVIAATNRPDIIDPAMLRPGRLDKLLYVPLPQPEDRVSILKTCARNTPMEADVDLKKIALSETLTGFTGADLASLVKEAAVYCLRRSFEVEKPSVSSADFEHALKVVHPSVSKRDQRLYKNLQSQLRRSRGNLQSDPEDKGNRMEDDIDKKEQ